MKKSVLLSLIALFVLPLSAVVRHTKQDSLIFEKYILDHVKDAGLPMGELIVRTALYFEGKPYVASTLDNSEQEYLTVNLREFDCTTFVESCMALAGTIKSEDLTFDNYCRMLTLIRYRHENSEDYASRLHYVSDWIYDNSERGILSDMSKDLGGITDNKVINFMSAHPGSYMQLKDDESMLQKIREVESAINRRGGYVYVKKEDIPQIEKDIKPGDIIVFATSVPGLDYSHMGIAYRLGGELSFIHASSKYKKIVVEPQSLSAYCMASRNCKGISVLRIND